VVEFVAPARERHGPDQALLAFVQRIRQFGTAPVHIRHIDTAYLLPAPTLDTYLPLYAIPFYRIFIMGQEEPFLVNAFTNVVM